MQPEQNQPAPPSTPVNEAPPQGDPATPQKPKGPPKWIWLVVAGAIILLIGGVWLLISLVMTSSRGGPGQVNNGQATQLTKLTIGSQPYIYPCDVATEADYARIFALDDTTAGTVSETSALPVKDITAVSSDLTKIAPVTSDTYDTDCSYTLAKKGATSMNRIDMKLVQFTSEEEASKDFGSSKSTAAGDFTRDNVDNGTKQLGKLPSFPDTSYVKLPEADSILPGLKATFVSGSHLITLEYNFGVGDTTDNTLTRLDEYAKAIQSKLNSYKDGKRPLDFTGRDTFVGKKFVNICQRTDLAKLGDALGTLQFRPDEATYTNIYGSLAGSRAAEDGVLSDCNIDFSTPGDRQAQAPLADGKSSRQATPSLDADDMWPHTLSLTVNSYRTAAEARASLVAKKQRAAAPIPNSGTPIIEDMAGIGDAAYKYHRESTLDLMFNAQSTPIVTIDDILVVASGSDVITVNLRQSSENKEYQTVPVETTEAQLKKAFEQLRDTLAANR